MSQAIPAGAAVLLRFIRMTETKYDAPKCYDVIYGHNEDKILPKRITNMTLDEVIALQPTFTKKFKSSATGAYQFMRNTLIDLKATLHLSGKEKMTGDFQDYLGYYLLKRRGYQAYVNGTLSINGFAKSLAQEWASLPVLVETQGAKRKVSRGQSYYAGDGLNKALVKPEAIEDILKRVASLEGRVVKNGFVDDEYLVPVTTDLPEGEKHPANRFVGAIVAGIAVGWAAIMGAFSWFATKLCDWFGLFCGV